MPITGVMRLRLAFLLTLVLALAAPSAASALTFKINNESGHSAEDVYVTITGTNFNVPGMADNVPKKLSEVPQPLTINTLHSGRVYVSYGAPVIGNESFSSQTRFDWAELTVTPSSDDVANLTAVDQFAIGMRLETFNAAGGLLETVGASNSDTIFNALQGIPGGPEATIRNGSGEIVRVLSPLHSAGYPDLSEYVKSMDGKEITLHTGLFFTPFGTSEYTGTFEADGSITLHGSTDPASMAPAEISFNGPELIKDSYTGEGTPNTAEGAIRHDVLAAFSAGFWGGSYGNDAIDFCTNPATRPDRVGSWCPDRFNKPAYAAARPGPSPFPTYEQYAAVIAQYAEEYGNPYSDASSKVAIGLSQPVDGGAVDALCLTILPDAGNSGPGTTTGNANCGVAAPAPAATVPPQTTTVARSKVRFRLAKKVRLRGAKLRVGKLLCAGYCGQVRAVARKGHKVIARAKLKVRAKQCLLVLKLTKLGKRILADKAKLKVQLVVWDTPAGSKTAHAHRKLLVLHGHHAARKGHSKREP